MSECALAAINLTKKYKHQLALDNVNLTVKQGDIYGFIGQNGAGKSTLIRIAMGLAFPTDGAIELFGKSSEQDLTQMRRRIGAIIESPALFPNMTAYENLEVHRLQKGIPGKACIERTLAQVGLQHTGRKVAKNFSLGMRQRLSLAIALLSEPEFLILDEPTNGLDPVAVVEIRELLKKINRENGVTVLISSHILSELHLLATKFGIIHKGRLLEELTARELSDKCQTYLHIKVNDPHKAAMIIESELCTTDFKVMPDGTIKLFMYLDQPSIVSTKLVRQGLALDEFVRMGEDLESYFVNLVGGTQHG